MKMKMLPLGRTDIKVSEWCLGTMTFSNQTPQADAHKQIDMALDAGINFLDTAEMYPVNPISADTIGNSESCLLYTSPSPRDKRQSRMPSSA